MPWCFKVHAILGIRPPAERSGRGSDSQDRMDQQHVRDTSCSGLKKDERWRLPERVGQDFLRLALQIAAAPAHIPSRSPNARIPWGWSVHCEWSGGGAGPVPPKPRISGWCRLEDQGSRRYQEISSLKKVMAERMGLGAAWPRPQIEASFMAMLNSVRRASSQAPLDISFTAFSQPRRQGVH